jgi:hypothetical protein
LIAALPALAVAIVIIGARVEQPKGHSGRTEVLDLMVMSDGLEAVCPPVHPNDAACLHPAAIAFRHRKHIAPVAYRATDEQSSIAYKTSV